MCQFFADAFIYPLERGDKVSIKAQWLVIAFIQRKPGKRLLNQIEPLGHEGSLPIPRRGGDQRQLTAFAQASMKLLQQARTGHTPGAPERDVEFGFQQARGHGKISVIFWSLPQKPFLNTKVTTYGCMSRWGQIGSLLLGQSGGRRCTATGP